MTLNEVIERRQSIRKYDGTTVSLEQIEQLVKCAQMAPSWKNTQTARYYVALSPEKLKQAREEGLLGRNVEKTEGTGALIVQSFVSKVAGHDLHGNPDNELGDGWGCYDAGAQSMLLQLKAAELGLDTLVLGIRDAAQLHRIMNIPENETITAAIAVGRRAETPNRPPRKAIEEILTVV